MKAFPSNEPIYGNDVVGLKVNFGMDLRDYFAAKAMVSLMANAQFLSQLNKENRAEHIANASYEMADVMMEARK